MSNTWNSEEGTESTVMDFDTNAAETRSFELLPDGEYRFTVAKIRVKPTRSGTGKVAAIEVAVDDDASPYKGRRVFCNFNVLNENKTAEAIGRGELKALLTAANMAGERDIAKLVGASVTGTVRTRKGDGQYDDQNVVKKWKPVGGAIAPPATAPAAKAPPAFMAGKPQLAR